MTVIEENRKTVQMMKKYSTDDDITSMTTYFTYVKQIVGAFPVLEEKVVVQVKGDLQPVGLSVKWYDINGKNGVSTYNFNYELGSVMFCLAALHSQAAYGYITVRFY